MSRYRPINVFAGSLSSLASQLRDELFRISQSHFRTDQIELYALHEEPAKPRDGMVVLADGTDWNPGSGAGFYGYYGSAWNKLG